MKCTIPGKGIKGESNPGFHNQNSCTQCFNLSLIFLAFGRAILCLSKIGEELYFEATSNGVRIIMVGYSLLYIIIILYHSYHYEQLIVDDQHMPVSRFAQHFFITMMMEDHS